MREIMLRAWDKTDKQWVNVNVLWCGGNLGFCRSWVGKENNELEIVQYTGLKDKNGKEIYEGDIVKFKWNRKYRTGEVAWGICGFWIVGWLKILEWAENKEVEVIGNIWENKELLNDS